jgi:prefoldin beta subunit
MELSEEMQGKLVQFQQLQQQIQIIATQKYQIDIQITEIEKTLEELDKLKKNSEVYKSVGNLLVRHEDREGLKNELKERKETLEIRAKTLGNQEKALRDRHRGLQEELSKALGTVEQENA